MTNRSTWGARLSQASASVPTLYCVSYPSFPNLMHRNVWIMEVKHAYTW
jgi:hypothetical protein